MKRSAMGHTNLKKLARRLNVPSYAAVGLMECLWHLTAREAPRGDLGKLSNEDIAEGLDWDGGEDLLVDTLIECRFLDVLEGCRLYVHDWHEHCEDAIHMSLARAVQTFANGVMPNMTRLSVQERDHLLQRYADAHKEPESSESQVNRAHKSAQERTETHAVRTAKPSQAKPSHASSLRSVGGCKGEETDRTPHPTKPPQPPPKGKDRVLSGNRPESMPEAQDYGAEIGLPNPQVERFCNFWDSRGWKGRTGAIVDWKAAMRTWKSKWLEEDQTKAARPKPKVKETVEQTYQRVQLELRSVGS